MSKLRKELNGLNQAQKSEDTNQSAVTEANNPIADATSNSEQRSDKPALNVSWIRDIVKFISWLGASVAGLSVILGAIGFLSLGAHDTMLGIPTTQIGLDYIKVGGLFFGRSILFMIGAVIGYRNCWMLSGTLLIILLIRYFVFKRHHQTTGLLVGASVLIIAESFLFWLLTDTLQFQDILLNFPDSNSLVLNAIFYGDQLWLRNEYGFLAVFTLCLAITLWHIEQAFKNKSSTNLSKRKIWQWLRIPAFVLLAVCLFLLPRCYGVLTFPNEFPQVVIEATSTAPNSREFKDLDTPLFLIWKDEKSLMLYDQRLKLIIALNPQSVSKYRISALKHIFNPGGRQ